MTDTGADTGHSTFMPLTLRRRGVQRVVQAPTGAHDVTLLAPDLVERFLKGRQPRRLTLMWFQRNSLPVDWAAQRALVASFEAEP